jgi:hypothetical protein
MGSKTVIEVAAAQAIFTSVDLEKKADIAHEERSTSSPPSVSKITVSIDLTAKGQYQKL